MRFILNDTRNQRDYLYVDYSEAVHGYPLVLGPGTVPIACPTVQVE
jgi:hypothetical protein